jgi:hypothetical protein
MGWVLEQDAISGFPPFKSSLCQVQRLPEARNGQTVAKAGL